MKRLTAYSWVIAGLLISNGGCETAAGPDPLPLPVGNAASAVFCGGCFWCMEPPFDKVDGVLTTISGYTGGSKENATYKEVSAGRTAHCEALMVSYDPKKVSYAKLVDLFWRNIDPLAKDRQFCDAGTQYRSALYYETDAEKAIAEKSLQAVKERFAGKAVHTSLERRQAFYPAEDYHQDFYKKDPDRYYSYRKGCGRDARLAELWGS